MQYSNFNSYIALARKEYRRIVRIWIQTLIPPMITQSLYFVIFGGIIGSQVSDIQGLSYMAYIVPGLVMMSIISNSFLNVGTSVYGAKLSKHIQELQVSSTPKWIVIAGICTGGLIRGMMNGGIVFLISLFFVRPDIYNAGIILFYALLSSSLFSLAGFMNGMFSRSFDEVSIFPTFILTPLTYLGGVFYAIKDLPEVFQWISRINPIVYMVDGFRAGFYGQGEYSFLLSSSILIILNIALFSISYGLLKRGYAIKS